MLAHKSGVCLLSLVGRKLMLELSMWFYCEILAMFDASTVDNSFIISIDYMYGGHFTDRDNSSCEWNWVEPLDVHLPESRVSCVWSVISWLPGVVPNTLGTLADIYNYWVGHS